MKGGANHQFVLKDGKRGRIQSISFLYDFDVIFSSNCCDKRDVECSSCDPSSVHGDRSFDGLDVFRFGNGFSKKLSGFSREDLEELSRDCNLPLKELIELHGLELYFEYSGEDYRDSGWRDRLLAQFVS
tara:strand:+ start:1178 stop:1564 length:387 start_codon:yes stop_codon:yes gene_type:complete